ncbi:MAG: hypothetical protein ACLRZH_11000 [Ruthenibacterium lactatiformans]
MGTRSKSKAAAGLLSALLLLALAVGLLAGLRPLYARAQEQGVLFYYYDPFVENIQTANHTLYWRAREQWEGKEFEPSELLLSDANAAVYAAREAGRTSCWATGAAGDESGGTNASYGGLTFTPRCHLRAGRFQRQRESPCRRAGGQLGQSVLRRDGRRNGQNIHQHGSRAWRLSFGRPAKTASAPPSGVMCWRSASTRRAICPMQPPIWARRAAGLSASIWNTDMQAYGTGAIRRHLDLTFCPTTIFPLPKA